MHRGEEAKLKEAISHLKVPSAVSNLFQIFFLEHDVYDLDQAMRVVSPDVLSLASNCI
jgi:ubiquinone biosynthesis protein COQ9